MTTPHVMDLLAHGIPVTLLMDLSEPNGPDSYAINCTERPPGDPPEHQDPGPPAGPREQMGVPPDPW